MEYLFTNDLFGIPIHWIETLPGDSSYAMIQQTATYAPRIIGASSASVDFSLIWISVYQYQHFSSECGCT